MNTKELVDHFITHSPKFNDDLGLDDIDDKHENIVKEAYLQINNGKAFTKNNFRNWKEQSDLGVPSQLSFSAANENGYLNMILKFAYRKLFRRDVDRFLLSAILDDIDVIKSTGGEKLLDEIPVHLTPGASEGYHINGTSVNVRWLKYIYILNRFLKFKLVEDNAIWVDVGSYYGGLQGLVRKYRPRSRIVMVDFHHQLCRSYIYLSELFPEAKHIMPDEVSNYKSLNDMPEGAIMYVPVSEYEQISEQKVDLVSNHFSLGEMRREFFNVYMNSTLFKKSKKVYIVNRFVSSPFFEKIYDTDLNILDYIDTERSVEYFDVFPVYHYMLMQREVFGRNEFRNLSSSFFEQLTSN